MRIVLEKDAQRALCPLTFNTTRHVSDQDPAVFGEVFGCMGSKCMGWVEQPPLGEERRGACTGAVIGEQILRLTSPPVLYDAAAMGRRK